MSKRKADHDAVYSVLQGLCIYGGLLATRQEVMEDLQALRGPAGERMNFLMIDRLTWMPKDATPEQAEMLQSRGMTLAKVRAAEGEA